MENNYAETAKVFKALADPNRLLIVAMLQGGEKCACTLLDDLHIGQSTLSYHMKTLCESGVVSCRREGKWMYYALKRNGCEIGYRLLTGIMEASFQTHHDESSACE